MTSHPSSLSRGVFTGLMIGAAIAGLCATLPAAAQATSRPCANDPVQEDVPGPACLMAHQSLGKLDPGPVYWTLESYPDAATAARHRSDKDTLVEAYGKVWLFLLGPLNARPATGERVATIGPIAIDAKVSYDAEFLKSTFSPGMKAPVHVHSGPEAFYAISGDTCLETPDGVQRGKGPGNIVLVRAGPPMLLMATGATPRKGFALILHDAKAPPTTLVHHWTPKGLCEAEVAATDTQ